MHENSKSQVLDVLQLERGTKEGRNKKDEKAQTHQSNPWWYEYRLRNDDEFTDLEKSRKPKLQAELNLRQEPN
ncbi:hypothetical protein RRG08_030102 [Elysia crispata]|uniref:Uncharacterized protein n=1 Tax=Elysia crispata TaxID=231223 RepID=A0AAE0ZR21_9GAST|nr:hypothetical protein RRG08_030102 [Elysia crispata]